MNSLILLALLPCVLGLGILAAAPPLARISNGIVSAELFLPDPSDGFYRGTRFDWSGTISSLEYKGHRFFAQWFARFDPGVRDIQFDPASNGYRAGAASANIGPVEEFSTPIGYSEAPVGGPFLKVGVGMLRRPQEERYGSFNPYEIVNEGTWNVRQESRWLGFTQELVDQSGYGYVYRRTVSLTKDKPELVLEHSLRHTGRRVIETPVYNHNFIVLDDRPSGPDFVIRFPFEVEAARDTQGLVETRVKEVVYLRELQQDERAMIPILGCGATAADYDITVENRRSKAGLRIRGDRPLTRLMFWTIRATRSPEAFIQLRVEPGSEFRWRIACEFYTLP
ncbi:MAG: hypothetical protein H6Q86_5755 [candidate division NC10 bacterium]|jgi:hypothetical protein|nr:hypothetical protein [candidate division NC10 bacterium]